MIESDWELAGLIDSEGRLTRPLQTERWRVPAVVELDGTDLRWDYRDGRHPGHRIGKMISPHPKLLEAFTALVGAEPETIRDYARKWGVLLICDHGVPGGHSAPRLPLSDVMNGTTDVRGCRPRGWPDCREPLAAWHRLAREASSILNVVASLQEKRPARRGDWQMVVARIYHGADGGDPWLDELNQPENAPAAQEYIEESVNRWLAYGGVQPSLAWPSKRPPTITFDSFGLFGALALQLLGVVTGTGWDVCSNCGGSFDPGLRRRNPNQRRYCDACRADGAQYRYASWAYRRRQEEQSSTTKSAKKRRGS
jgi:hypothetical protein